MLKPRFNFARVKGGINLYGFVDQNPVNLVDSWGLFVGACLGSVDTSVTDDSSDGEQSTEQTVEDFKTEQNGKEQAEKEKFTYTAAETIVDAN